ncbi:MAG: 23S rRNA pseudouridine955/2504/2580 synthase [Rickettsiales bacterium]|jgi:23S rRNA pseudouridine955/2504/2580 synthase
MNKFTVNIDSAGSRLDKFLAKNGLGFTLAQKLLRQKDVKVNSRKVAGDCKLEEGDFVEVFGFNPKGEARAKPKVSEEKISLIKKCVIYKDENLLAINKPSGIAVQAGSPKDFSIDAALPYLKFELEETPRLVHRLDRETSGILLLARNRKTATLLSEGFKNKTINKTYLALVRGVPNKREDIISMKLLEKTFGNTKKVFKSDLGKEAITHYKNLKVFDIKKKLKRSKKETKPEIEPDFTQYSLMELKPITGRMHQLRIHCKEIGHPIIGDGKYGKNNELADKNRLCLHSFKIEIADFFGKKLLIDSKEPDFI